MATLSTQSRIEQIDAFVVEAAKDVCSTMLDWLAVEDIVRPSEDPTSFALDTINGCIGFAGRLTGSIFLCCDDQTATRMAQVIMGSDHQPSVQDLSDVIAELTNMLAGGCKSRLCDHDCPVVMSIPNIIRGNVIRAASRNVSFILKRRFEVSISEEKFQVILLGKFE